MNKKFGGEQMDIILRVDNLCKNYDNTPVLSNINLSISRGEFVAIMGQSGSGKSTLLYAISGMDKCSSGKIFFKDKDISSLDEKDIATLRLHNMGFVFQHSYLLKNFTIRDNVMLPGFKANNLSNKEIINRATDLMKQMNVLEVADHDINKVSGGQLQRAAISRALINKPDILFADEPTGALNTSNTNEVMNIFSEVNRAGATIVLVTHDAKVACRSQRIVYLKDGRIDDQLMLGKYSCKYIEAREKKLNLWLMEKGF